MKLLKIILILLTLPAISYSQGFNSYVKLPFIIGVTDYTKNTFRDVYAASDLEFNNSADWSFDREFEYGLRYQYRAFTFKLEFGFYNENISFTYISQQDMNFPERREYEGSMDLVGLVLSGSFGYTVMVKHKYKLNLGIGINYRTNYEDYHKSSSFVEYYDNTYRIADYKYYELFIRKEIYFEHKIMPLIFMEYQFLFFNWGISVEPLLINNKYMSTTNIGLYCEMSMDIFSKKKPSNVYINQLDR